MPGNPKKCRAHALRCDKLARAATTPDARQHFLGLSETWKRLAAEFEAVYFEQLARLAANADLDLPRLICPRLLPRRNASVSSSAGYAEVPAR